MSKYQKHKYNAQKTELDGIKLPWKLLQQKDCFVSLRMRESVYVLFDWESFRKKKK